MSRRILEREIDELNRLLKNPLTSSASPRMKYTLICAAYFTLVFAVAFVYVLVLAATKNA